MKIGSASKPEAVLCTVLGALQDFQLFISLPSLPTAIQTHKVI